MKRKIKRFAEGDEVIDMRSDTSMPTGIDDSVRARAMKFLEKGMKDEEPSSSKPRAMIKKTTKTIVESPKSKSSSEPKGFKVPEAEPGLENVSPELDLLPIGKVAGALGVGYLGARALGKRILGKRASDAAEKIAGKSERTRASGAMERDFKPEQMREGFKRGGKTSSFKQGGSVKRSSASSRADGCATKGHTRGKIC
jgi:hypothetical protein